MSKVTAAAVLGAVAIVMNTTGELRADVAPPTITVVFELK